MNVLLVCVILFALWRGYAGMKKGMVDETEGTRNFGRNQPET